MRNYKDTLNILKTDFEMKGNLSVKEPLIQKQWLDKKIYQSLLAQNKGAKQWTLHDGPPYANGNIHVGHALNKIIKDIIVRHRSMQGHYSNYIAGWDTHGLPIEHALLKSGVNKDPNLTINQKRNNCRDFAANFIKLQIEQFARLGMLTDFHNIYRTYDVDYETRQLKLLASAFNKKLIYQDLKPVYWSWSSQTALADAEIEYKDVKSPSIYVSFKVETGNKVVQKGDEIIIWTTTPWTIPSNLAISANPKFVYVRVNADKRTYIVSKERMPEVAKELGWIDFGVIDEFSGVDLEDVKYVHPICKRVSPVILAAYVSNTDGTGLVHNAPGFGTDDYLVCKKYGIEPYSPIDNYGKFTKEIDDKELESMFYDDANKIITTRLSSKNALLKISFINHSVAHDWRTKKPVIYRATKQWFIDIKQIQSEILSALDKVSFINPQQRNHIIDMIKNRTEWCISRQRVWGVPIPIIFDENNEPIFDVKLINHIIDILGKESTNVWFDKPVEYFLTKEYLAKDNHHKYRKEQDTMDVWFDSGTSFTLLNVHGLHYPADLYFEGNDQYRGWFNSSLINGVIQNNEAPYKMLLSHGMVLDEQERKMSKSEGNVIDPLEVCKKYGADILRIWVANSNYQEDVRISDGILVQNAEIYRRLRNTLFKFCLANVSDFNYEDDANTDFSEVDRVILTKLAINIEHINLCYEQYDFMTVIRLINNHIIELSAWYFDIVKDTLYCEDKDNERRRTIQTVLFHVLRSYLTMLAPIMPHTCEEVYSFMNIGSKKESIFLEKWISKLDIEFKKVDADKWLQFIKIKNEVYASLEKLRTDKTINKNNQAFAEITFNNKYAFIDKELAKYLNIAKVKIINAENDMILVSTGDAKLIKCERCWNYYDQDEMHDTEICNRCQKVIANNIN